MLGKERDGRVGERMCSAGQKQMGYGSGLRVVLSAGINKWGGWSGCAVLGVEDGREVDSVRGEKHMAVQ